ncbi:MAG: hypothetical protein HKP44_15420 [Desulfofustis sp.]|nr:hypothetical protein [Desulfofustis sp.]
MTTENQQTGQQITIQYKETSALYASQFIINTTTEDLVINFSSGYLADQRPQGTVLPIHTRISMTHEGARRLYDLLGKSLSKSHTETDNPGDAPDEARAKLPGM